MSHNNLKSTGKMNKYFYFASDVSQWDFPNNRKTLKETHRKNEYFFCFGKWKRYL